MTEETKDCMTLIPAQTRIITRFKKPENIRSNSLNWVARSLNIIDDYCVETRGFYQRTIRLRSGFLIIQNGMVDPLIRGKNYGFL